MWIRRLVVLFFIMLVTAVPVFAQQPTDPNAQIIWPPPTFVLNGGFSIYGTANVPGMVGYYFEFRPMIDSVTPSGDNVPWSPASLPIRNPVVNNVLGIWDTTQIPDGLYELRLAVITGSGQPIYSHVSPLRVMNFPSRFATIAPAQPAFPTTAPQPTQFPGATSPVPDSQSPMAQATIDANVRLGDSTRYEAIGALLRGQSAPIIGRSNTGSGWWLIQLPNGRQGWIASSTVLVSGNIGSVPIVSPPPVPATPTPTPTITPTLALLPDATIGNVRFDRSPKQGEMFQVIVTVLNQSSVALPEVTVACNFTPMNAFFSTPVSGLAPFGQIDVPIPVQLNSGGGANITANCAVDVNNLVAELNESNNFFNLTGLLASP